MASVLRLALMAILAFAALHPAQAQPWPSRPIVFVVGFAPGGSTDIAARLLAAQLGEALGQQVVVENRTGASGSIAQEYVARARPDGYTFLFASSGTMAANVSLFRNLPYDPVRDYTPISQLTLIPAVLAVHPSVPARNVAELAELARSRPGQLHYGSAGVATLQHIAGALFARQSRTDIVHIPYRGGAPANADLAAGRVQMVFGPIVELLPAIQSGQVRALGVTTDRPSAALPDVPPIAAAVPGYSLAAWHGLVGPAGTPPAIVARMHREVVGVLNTASLRARFAELGLDVVGNSPEEFAQMIPREIERWRELVQLSGAQME